MKTAAGRGGNREKLLAGALACLREKGYAGTTARDLVAASGTNLNSIGYHYGSKDALLGEAIIAGFREWTAEAERSGFAAGPLAPSERLRRSLAALIDRFEELRPFLVSFAEAFPPALHSPELRERMAAAYEEVRSRGADMVLRAVAEDGLRMEREQAETISSVLTALVDGLILQWLLDPARTPSSEGVIAALAAVGTAFAGERA